MLDPVVHFPEDCADTAPLCPTPTPWRSRDSQSVPHSGEEMEKQARNLAKEFMDVATGDRFLLQHLVADLHVVRGKQQTLVAQIKHGLLEPSQPEVHFWPNEDGCNMSLKRKRDFVDRSRQSAHL
jgi:hypothetical protein